MLLSVAITAAWQHTPGNSSARHPANSSHARRTKANFTNKRPSIASAKDSRCQLPAQLIQPHQKPHHQQPQQADQSTQQQQQHLEPPQNLTIAAAVTRLRQPLPDCCARCSAACVTTPPRHCSCRVQHPCLHNPSRELLSPCHHSCRVQSPLPCRAAAEC